VSVEDVAGFCGSVVEISIGVGVVVSWGIVSFVCVLSVIVVEVVVVVVVMVVGVVGVVVVFVCASKLFRNSVSSPCTACSCFRSFSVRSAEPSCRMCASSSSSTSSASFPSFPFPSARACFDGCGRLSARVVVANLGNTSREGFLVRFTRKSVTCVLDSPSIPPRQSSRIAPISSRFSREYFVRSGSASKRSVLVAGEKRAGMLT
jgi:hypothetical protein